MKRVIDYEPMTGITTTFEYDHASGTFTVGSIQDVGPLLERNKTLQLDTDYSKKGIKKDWWHYASIPNVIIEKWLNEDGINVYNKDHTKAVYKKLNDPAYKYLKTTTGFHMPKS